MNAGLEDLSAPELLRLSAAAHDALRSRGVIRTSNAVGDFAEHLFTTAFGWTLQRNSNAGYDAEHEGVRYQIKCRRLTRRNPSRQLGEFSKFDKRRFDQLAAVIFSEDFAVERAAIMPHAAVARLSSVVLGRQRFILRDAVWSDPDVRDVTDELRRVWSAL